MLTTNYNPLGPTTEQPKNTILEILLNNNYYMKQKTKLFLMLMTMLISQLSSWGAEETITFSGMFNNGDEVSTVERTNFTVTFNKGTSTNAPKYYTTGAAVRVYGGGYFTVSSSYTITKIELTFSSGEGSNAISTDVATYSNGTWTGSSNNVKFTIGGSSGHRRIAAIKVTYSTSSIATPTFSPEAGEVAKGTSVTFNCSTEGVTFYYTTNGTEPTTSSATGSSYTVNSNVTLKVIAVKNGESSSVATAEYTVTKPSPNLAFSETSVTANIGEAFTPPTLTYADGYDGTITYSSSNSAITVNAATGEVTFDASAVGKTTTITATGSETNDFNSGTASYVLTVINPNAVSGNLNNETFGTNYDGTAAGFTSATGYIGNVEVTYARGDATTAYINDSQIRLYNGSLLTFVAPEGYYIQSLVFDTTLSGVSETSGHGNVSGNMWSCSENEELNTVTLTKTTSKGLALSTVTITLISSASAVAKPTITPASGTYTEAQTVTITNNAEGATVYYTTDGTTPTASSTPYSGPFTLSKSGTYTIKAIAIAGEQSSLIATSTITINIVVPTPTFTEASGTAFSEPYTIHLTAPEGYTIYYTTGATSPVTSDGALSGSAISYNATTGIANLSKAVTINAVAVDQNGNVSEVVTASYSYSGEVQVPYYENFDEGLGNFTTTSTNNVKWEFQVNHDVATYGEERKYAYISGGTNNTAGTYVGSDRLISPVIDLSELENATMNFIHAGHWFGTASDGTDSGDSDDEAKKASCHLQIKTETGDWVDITDRISNWFVQSRVNGHNMYERVNSGDINLSDYAGNKVQICFYFTSTASQSGTWNVLKFAVTGTKPEESYETVTMSTDGYVTYVVQNDIDWVKTLAKNTTENGNNINIHGYKVVEFTKETAVFVEFGATNTSTTHDKWYSEDMIPAETPIILKGTKGGNNLVIAKHDDVISKPVGNLLKPSYGDVTASADQHLLVFQKIPNVWSESDPYHNYAFYRLATGRTIPNRKAYLNGNDFCEEVSVTSSNPTNGIYLLEDLGNDTSGIVDLTAQQPKAFDPNAAVYDLSGRKVAEGMTHLPKGLYIISGRKVVIR